MGKTCSVLACLVLAGFATLEPLSVAAQAQGFKPQPISGTISFGPPTPGTCSFQVDIFFQGKAGQINLPGGRIILTSTALRATLTNHSNPSSSVTLNTTGAFHQSFPSNGDVVTVVTGRNILVDPIAGFVLAIGTFSFVFDANGNLVQPLIWTGQLVDICKLLS